MLVRELIALLGRCCQDDEVEVFHFVHNGGGDDPRFEIPSVLTNCYGYTIISPDTISHYIENISGDDMIDPGTL